MARSVTAGELLRGDVVLLSDGLRTPAVVEHTEPLTPDGGPEQIMVRLRTHGTYVHLVQDCFMLAGNNS